MEPFTTLTARAIALDRVNVDTDQIIPARFLRRPRDAGYGQFLFHDIRAQDAAFERARNDDGEARILVASDNFGCGSSREGAVWALAGQGLRAWIAPSFGDIFLENSCKNGCLPIVLPPIRVAALREALQANPGMAVTIDLPSQRVTWAGEQEPFDIDAFRKECLLRGVDEIAITLQHGDAIAAYERRQREETPWLSAPGS